MTFDFELYVFISVAICSVLLSVGMWATAKKGATEKVLEILIGLMLAIFVGVFVYHNNMTQPSTTYLEVYFVAFSCYSWPAILYNIWQKRKAER